MPAIEPDFFRFSKICSAGVKLKSASITTTSCSSGAVALVVDDERRRHQPLLLQPLMRVHPERAAEAQGEVVVGAAARGNRGSGNPRHAVLPPRRREPVPMDQARFADAVFDPDAKGLADLSRDAKGPVWLSDAVDRRRLAVHLDIAPLKAQDRRRRRGAVCRALRPGEDRRRRQARNAASKKCASGQHGKPPHQISRGREARTKDAIKSLI